MDRRRTYLDFLLALTGALAQLRHIANAADVVDRRQAAGGAMSENKVYENREKMLMGADRSVLAAAENAFMALVGLRRAVAGGALGKTAAYHDAYHAYAAEVWHLRSVLRLDLGSTRLTLSDLDRQDWDSAEHCAFCLG